MECALGTIATDNDTETDRHRDSKMIPGLILLGLFFITLLYAVQTLKGMRHRAFYPLMRLRRPDGSMEPVPVQTLRRNHCYAFKEDQA